MSTDTNNQESAAETSSGEESQASSSISLSRTEYEELLKARADFGSLKRDFKDLKKSLETRQETETTPKNQLDSSLMQKTYLRAAGITDNDEVELALSTAKKWGVEVDALVDDEDFKLKLEKIRTNKANQLATTGIQGGSGSSEPNTDPSRWLTLGRPPTREEIPDRKARAKIAREFMAKERGKSSGFYNE